MKSIHIFEIEWKSFFRIAWNACIYHFIYAICDVALVCITYTIDLNMQLTTVNRDINIECHTYMHRARSVHFHMFHVFSFFWLYRHSSTLCASPTLSSLSFILSFASLLFLLLLLFRLFHPHSFSTLYLRICFIVLNSHRIFFRSLLCVLTQSLLCCVRFLLLWTFFFSVPRTLCHNNLILFWKF